MDILEIVLGIELETLLLPGVTAASQHSTAWSFRNQTIAEEILFCFQLFNGYFLPDIDIFGKNKFKDFHGEPPHIISCGYQSLNLK